MSGPETLQTVTAALALADLTRQVCRFFKHVKDADETATEAYNRADRLSQVLEAVLAVLNQRIEYDIAPHDARDVKAENRIAECIHASKAILYKIGRRVGGFHVDDEHETFTKLVERFKLAWRQSGIIRLQNALEANVTNLQNELVLLHLSDQTRASRADRLDHAEVMSLLEQLRMQVEEGKLVSRQLFEQRRSSRLTQDASDATGEAHGADEADEGDDDALDILQAGLTIAEDMHKEYTTEYYVADDRSERIKGLVGSSSISSSRLSQQRYTPSASPSVAPSTPSGATVGRQIPALETNDRHPLETLDRFIKGHINRASREREQCHYRQAEEHFERAMQYLEKRQVQYEIEFTDRAEMHEELASLFMKQEKWGEAVAKVWELLREETNPSVQARQHHLLASIYHDRHKHQSGQSLSNTTSDVANAKRYAQEAYYVRYHAPHNSDDATPEAQQQYEDSVWLLVRIHETLGETVEAWELIDSLEPGGTSEARKLSRTPTSIPESQAVSTGSEGSHVSLVKAIAAGNAEQITQLLSRTSIDVNEPCQQHKTALIHAVERSDTLTVQKLLDPEVGADVNKTNRYKTTALHHASALGIYEMAQLLLDHDAQMEAHDREGETPIAKAVSNGHGTVVQILCDRGANMLAKNKHEWSLLHLATTQPRVEMITQLLDLCPDLREAIEPRGKTALHLCVESNRYTAAAALLKHPRHALDANASDSNSRYPLYYTASGTCTPERQRMVALLVEHKGRLRADRMPTKWRDYPELVKLQAPRERHDSVRSQGSTGSVLDRLGRWRSNPM